jgi:DNA-directed RNA polymerase subunit M/transcription elongation factor TFIIS
MPGTRKKYEDKIHCRKCGRKRNGRLAFLMQVPVENEPEKTQTSPVWLNIRNFYRIAAEQKHVQLPTALFGHCGDCGTQTFYHLNKQRKLELIEQ